MKQKILNEKNIMKLFMIFLIIQPILDIYVLFEPEVIAFFGFSPSTIIRMGVICLLVLMLFFTTKFEKKYIWYIAYLSLVGIYVLLHHFNATKFVSQIEGDFGYSLISEIFYIIRMLLPLTMIVISKRIKMNTHKLEFLMRWLMILLSGSIVVCNLLVIGRGSYTNEALGMSMPMWFIDRYQTYNYLEFASKAFFMYANQISALLLLLTPIWFYILVKRPNKYNMIITVFHILAMFMIGTKVASVGLFLVLILTVAIYFFFCYTKKELLFSKKVLASLICYLILYFVILPFSPAVNRSEVDKGRGSAYRNEQICEKITYPELPQLEYNVIVEELKTEDKDKCPTIEKIENEKIEYVKENLEMLETAEEKKAYLVSFLKEEYENFALVKAFVTESYPYDQEPYFWFDIMQEPLLVRTDFRHLEKEMLESVKRYNNKKSDDWLGITYIRMNNIFNLERDFLSHYYTLGIIGLILLISPYFIIVLYAIFKILFDHKKCMNFYNVMFLLAIGITLFAAFYSGNVMDGLVVTLILGFVFGQLLQSLTSKKVSEKNNKKVSVIMPTYNDSETIIETLDSLVTQTYSNWELCIIDDGSTDETKKVIEDYKKRFDPENRIIYTYQENTDQLKAIIHGTEIITGDYIFILHSDDLLASPDTLEKAVNYMKENPKLDAIIADLIIIDENSKVTGRQNVSDYNISKKIPVLQLLWLGRNLYVDVGFFKKSVYLKEVKENYLTWNMPFWLNSDKKVDMLNVEKVDFEFLKYRVHSGNYINNEIGKLNVLNGEIRTVTRLMKHYEIPKYNIQYLLFRVFSKLGLLSLYYPIYKNKETKNKAELLDFVISKRFTEGYKDNLFLNSVVLFYENYQERKIKFESLYDGEEIYSGNQMRKFNKQLVENKLPNCYKKIMKEMQKGFDEIIVTSDEEYEKALNLTKFLCIYPYVKITKK